MPHLNATLPHHQPPSPHQSGARSQRSHKLNPIDWLVPGGQVQVRMFVNLRAAVEHRRRGAMEVRQRWKRSVSGINVDNGPKVVNCSSIYLVLRPLICGIRCFYAREASRFATAEDIPLIETNKFSDRTRRGRRVFLNRSHAEE